MRRSELPASTSDDDRPLYELLTEALPKKAEKKKLQPRRRIPPTWTILRGNEVIDVRAIPRPATNVEEHQHMPTYVSEGEGGSFSKAPEGLHAGVCCDVVPVDNVETQYGLRDVVWLGLQLDEVDPESKPPRKYVVWRRFGRSLAPKSSLKPFLEAWRGKKFTEEELKRFDLDMLIGANAQIQIVHAEVGEKTYANVAAVVPAGKGAPKLKIEGYDKNKDRPPFVTGGANDTRPKASAPAAADDDEVPF